MRRTTPRPTSYVRILEHVQAFGEQGPLVLGCTATPERADGAPLGDIFEAIVYRKTLLEMIEAGYSERPARGAGAA